MIGIVIDFENSDSPKYIQLYDAIKREIVSGKLLNGEKLPSVRNMAKMLAIGKVTVENAYSQLLVEGYIESKEKSGYYVTRFEANEFGHFKAQLNLPTRQKSTAPLIKQYHTDGSDADAFNFQIWKKAVNKVLEYQYKDLLNYGDVQGEYTLRYEIAEFVHQSRGGICSPEQVVIGAGIQYLFGLIATIFRKTEHQIAFEYPGFTKGMYIFEDYGFETEKIPLELDGINVDRLMASSAKIVYVSPSHQYPTGSIMPVKKRLQLIDWAKSKDGYIIEDDYDSVLRYEGYPVPALQGLSDGGNVIYVGSFSKLLIPALRISFMILPHSLMPIFEAMKTRYSQSVSKIEQLALANFMKEGAFERHIRRIKKIYGRKNQLLIDAFQNNPSPLFELIGMGSGVHVMLRFKNQVNIIEMMNATKQLGIVLEGINDFDQKNIIVFSYSGIPDHQIEEVVDQIKTLATLHAIKKRASS